MENHISAKKLRAVRAYTEIFKGTTEENMQKLRDVSSDEIYDMIKEYRRKINSESVQKKNTEVPSVPETENTLSKTEEKQKNSSISEAPEKKRNLPKIQTHYKKYQRTLMMI